MSEQIRETVQSKKHIIRMAGTLDKENVATIREHFGPIIETLRDAQVFALAHIKKKLCTPLTIMRHRIAKYSVCRRRQFPDVLALPPRTSRSRSNF